MKKHYVEFFSPGTFFAETTTKEIGSWDVGKAVKMAKVITERHGAKPYGFAFTTRERGPDDFDSKETKRSGMHYLRARVMTLADVKREMPDQRILIGNMECNRWDKIVVSANGYRWTQPLHKGDRVLEEVK